MVLSDDSESAARAKSYRNLCFREERRFYHTELGYNFRMTSLQAALGLAQLEKIEELASLKRRITSFYQDILADIPGVCFQAVKPWARPISWMNAITLDPSLCLDAQDAIKRLKERNIEARPFFLGLHAQPALKKMGLFYGESYPHTDEAAKYGLYLPSGMTLTTRQIAYICEALGDILRGTWKG